MGRLFRLSVVALLTATAAPAQTSPTLEAVLTKLHAYMVTYCEQYSATIATERYKQTSGLKNDPLYREAFLESDYGIIRLPGIAQWLGLRDVYRVNGRAVADRQDRLAQVFSSASANYISQANRVVEDSARFNIGPVKRTINNPALVLEFLDPANEFRLKYSKADEDTQDGAHLWVIRFVEQFGPTLVRSSTGDDEPAEGRVWLEPNSGRIYRVDMTIRPFGPRAPAFRATLSVVFALDERLHIWLPAKMTEHYEGTGIDWVDGEATYSDYRQFGVKTEESFAPATH